MTDPKVEAIERKLDEKLARLKNCTEPNTRRTLLAEMRVLLAELDHLVYTMNSK